MLAYYNSSNKYIQGVESLSFEKVTGLLLSLTVLAIIALPVYAQDNLTTQNMTRNMTSSNLTAQNMTMNMTSANQTMQNMTSNMTSANASALINLVASNIRFNTSSITVPAGSDVTVNFENRDSGKQHNLAVYETYAAQNAIFKGQAITGPGNTTYTFTAPDKPGNYIFRDDSYPSMTGAFMVK